jgi:hypothetical protein
VALGLREWRPALVAGGVAGDEREPACASVEAVSAKTAPDAVGGDAKSSPALARELGRDAPGTEAGMGEREGEDALLEVRPELVGHARAAALSHSESLQAPAVDAALPAVVGRVVHAHGSAGGADADLAREREEA